MPKTLLIQISADPRTSPRPAEAIRIAAGVGAWEKVRVDVYLQSAAIECLTEFPEELESGQLLAEYLPAIAKHGGKIYTEQPNATYDYVMEFRADSERPETMDYEAFLDQLF